MPRLPRGLYIPNPAFARLLASQEEVKGALADKAEEVRPKAEQNAPRIMRRNPQAFEVQSDGDGVYLVNTDYGGHLAEWGSVNNAPQAPLRRAVRATPGLRLEEQGK